MGRDERRGANGDAVRDGNGGADARATVADEGAAVPEYDGLVEAIDDPVFVFSVDRGDSGLAFSFQRANPAAETHLGIETETDRGRGPQELFGDEGEDVLDRYRDCVERRETITYERLPAGNDGESRAWEITLTPIDDLGEVKRVAGIAREITDRRERERELERHTQQLRTIFEEAPDGIIVHDAEGRILDVNETIVETLGYTRRELLSMEIPDIEVGIDEERLRTQWQSMDPGSMYKVEIEGVHRRKCGSTYPVDVWVSRVETAETEPDRFVALTRDITTQKERERELRQFREVVEQTAHAVYITDTDGTIEYVNPAFEEVTGYSEAEALGRTPRILQSDEYSEEFYEDFWEVLNAGEQWEDEMIDRRADGSRIVIHQTVSPITDADGEAQKFVAVAQDVTQRKEYEEALERAHEELREVIDLVPDPIAVKNRDGEYLLANEAIAEAFGATAEEIEGKKDAAVVPNAEDAERFREDDMAVIESGDPMTIPEDELTTADGETRILRTTRIPYEAATGEDAVLAYARDVTELKEYEAKLAAERDFLNSVIESIPYPFYVIDTDDYTIQYANSEAIAESGTTCYEATHGRENPCDEGDDTAPCPLSEVRETREPTTVEHTHTDEAGNERVFRIHSSPIFDDEGNPVWMAESNIDITDRVEYERELESQRDNLEMLNRVVRHDIRNDMTVVNGRANLLEAHVEESGQEDLAAIQRATENAIELTKTARDLSETMLSTEEDVEPVGLAHHLEAPIENARSTFEHALITVEDRIPDVEVPGNELLEAVFRNLIQNAIVHNDKEAPKVHVSTSRREETVTIAIADNGPGIPDEQKEQIFGKGEKGLDSPGTGIGLYLVETLVEQYGGEVWVEDRGDTEAAPDSWGDEDDPEGSVFYVELPRFA